VEGSRNDENSTSADPVRYSAPAGNRGPAVAIGAPVSNDHRPPSILVIKGLNRRAIHSLGDERTMEAPFASPQSIGPLELFFSYSHKDRALRDKLETALSTMKRQDMIETWHDRRIAAGEKWADQIDEHLNTAQIILLLISPDFVSSDYCYGREMLRARERHARGEAQLISVILRPGEYLHAPFRELQCLPEGGRPVTKWRNRDEAFANVAEGIRKAVDQLIDKIRQRQRGQLFELHEVFQMMKRQNDDFNNAMTIADTISSDDQMTQTKRWKILQETQQQILLIQQDVAANKFATRDAAHKNWDQYIRGETG
jgi:hypothetical protein